MAEQDGEAPGTATGEDQGRGFLLIGAGVVAAAFLTFVGQNTDSVDISWLFFESRSPLWLALVVSVLVGVVLGEIGGFALRRRRRRKV